MKVIINRRISMIGNDWDILLKEEYQKEYFKKLLDLSKKNIKKKQFIQKRMKYLMLYEIQNIKM